MLGDQVDWAFEQEPAGEKVHFRSLWNGTSAYLLQASEQRIPQGADLLESYRDVSHLRPLDMKLEPALEEELNDFLESQESKERSKHPEGEEHGAESLFSRREPSALLDSQLETPRWASAINSKHGSRGLYKLLQQVTSQYTKRVASRQKDWRPRSIRKEKRAGADAQQRKLEVEVEERVFERSNILSYGFGLYKTNLTPSEESEENRQQDLRLKHYQHGLEAQRLRKRARKAK